MSETVGKGRVLIVEDEAKIVELLRLYLERDGYQVSAAADGPQALELAEKEKPDLVLLDLNLPGMDGLEVCRRLRARGPVPIIMLTARGEEVDRIVGLELGADDYVSKPFSPREVVARVRAVLRRSAPSPPQERRRFGPLEMDLARHEVTVDGQPVALTATEFRLLETMSAESGRVFTRSQLLDRVWGEVFEGYERTIDSHIKNLRRKIEPQPQSPRFVHTVFGVGYKFQDGGTAGRG